MAFVWLFYASTLASVFGIPYARLLTKHFAFKKKTIAHQKPKKTKARVMRQLCQYFTCFNKHTLRLVQSVTVRFFSEGEGISNNNMQLYLKYYTNIYKNQTSDWQENKSHDVSIMHKINQTPSLYKAERSLSLCYGI
jgi:transposase-like protein